jgi:hypothetical protein
MEIVRWNKKGEKGYMVRVDREEAVHLIMSLATQIHCNNKNSTREEFITNKGEYFSVAVEPVES